MEAFGHIVPGKGSFLYRSGEQIELYQNSAKGRKRNQSHGGRRCYREGWCLVVEKPPSRTGL
ncbi:hypothetical protein Syun_029543 [Stephania yunnanensis]|uniref:Uncharacterized protein n=1 Tax=Stephania yunnanensis TaxID=152371 RepID=A0AAP0HHD8_9MAGN